MFCCVKATGRLQVSGDTATPNTLCIRALRRHLPVVFTMTCVVHKWSWQLLPARVHKAIMSSNAGQIDFGRRHIEADRY